MTTNADHADGAPRRALNTLDSRNPAASAAARSAVCDPSVRGSWAFLSRRSSGRGWWSRAPQTMPCVWPRVTKTCGSMSSMRHSPRL